MIVSDVDDDDDDDDDVLATWDVATWKTDTTI